MRRIWFAIYLGLVLLLGSRDSLAQVDDVVCRNGVGNFEGEFQRSEVRVGATKTGGLGSRSCEATLRQADQSIVVATGATEIDLDAFGVELGVGGPVAAFQIKKSEPECCRSYQIYSLQKGPHLLRTLNGGSYFRASDVDLDGGIEIWTDDAAAVDQFENLSLAELDFAPPLVLRFELNQLVDVSSQFQSYFDDRIAQQRAKLDKRALKDFKDSDGKILPSLSAPAEQAHRLRKTKIAVLEIVWSYLYSGRDEQAWNTLSDLWPEKDAARIREEIISSRNRGMRAQIDGTTKIPAKHRKHTEIYDVTQAGPESAVVPPQGIMLRQSPDQSPNASETDLDLVIDAAGKVRSAELVGKGTAKNRDLIDAAMAWTFIPALKGGRPVASRTRIAISPRR
jgi:hypothetical protein